MDKSIPMMVSFQPRNPMPRVSSVPVLGFASVIAAALALGLCFPAPSAALETATPSDPAQAKPTPTHKPAHGHLKAKPQPQPAQQIVPVVIAPPPPEPPHWPVNDQAENANVVWDSHGLRIDAANSSLQAILQEVSTATGASVEGLPTDERVFGVYGPGEVREVLSQLLQGSGYNVVMIGDQGSGAPRQIVLSARQAGNVQPGGRPPAQDEETEVEEAPPPPQPPQELQQPHFTPPPGREQRLPQQIQELRQRDRDRQQQIPQN